MAIVELGILEFSQDSEIVNTFNLLLAICTFNMSNLFFAKILLTLRCIKWRPLPRLSNISPISIGRLTIVIFRGTHVKNKEI